MTKKLTLSVRTHISYEDIKNLLDSASRGADYWARTELAYESETEKALTVKGVGIIDFEDEDYGTTYVLNLKKIKRGLTSMAKKDPKHFADFISEDYDMITGDVFLQHCLFGEIIYG